ncbi:MAG: GTP cyclohydrolase I [Acinetobacter sp.]|nr:GTP cyclohydrolase I [Acinetobacter sp.]
MKVLTMRTGDSVELTDQEKAAIIEEAAKHYGKFLSALGFNWSNDPHMEGTPERVAKAWVQDLVAGCYQAPPTITSFQNNENFNGMVIQKNIEVCSLCAHHNLPFKGKCTIAYLPSSQEKGGQVVGLSKLNRIAKYFAQRPTVQELVTKQIHDFVSAALVGNRGVAVVINSEHCCVSCRGVRDDSEMVTSQLSGYFYDNSVGTRTEFFSLLK